MMPGITAQPLSIASGEAPGWLPDGADGMLDFVNGRYYLAGQPRAIATMLGGGFDPAAISGSGMYIDFTNDNRPTPINALLTRLLSGLAAGMTLVFEVTTENSFLEGVLLYIGVDPAFDDAFSWNVLTLDGRIFDEGVLDLNDPVSGAATHRIACTYNRDVGGGTHEYALGHDGGSAVTQTTPYAAWTMTDAQLGHDGSSRNVYGTFIRSIAFYPALDPSSLPALTA